MYLALDLQAEADKENRKFPVVPVLLNGAEVTTGFLFLNTWVDLRETPADSPVIDSLLAGLDGTAAPGVAAILVPIGACGPSGRKMRASTSDGTPG